MILRPQNPIRLLPAVALTACICCASAAVGAAPVPAQASRPAAAAAPPAHPGAAPKPGLQVVSAATTTTTTTVATKVANATKTAARRRGRGARGHLVSGPLSVIRRANADARSGPAANAFLNATLVYDYEPGRLYRIDASPRFLTTIALRPGEHLISKASGDTVRWVLGETAQGSGDGQQVIVFVKPVRGGQRTNVVLTTDQRIYHLEAVSHEEPTYTSVISWNYPVDQAREAQAAAVRLATAQAAQQAAEQATVVESAIPVDNLHFAYKLEHPHQKHGPAWEPARVFDDGAKTYIQFPATLGVGEAPPLFLIGRNNSAELVNYRVHGSFYVVDRLIDVAELRLGEKPQTVVRITRTGARG